MGKESNLFPTIEVDYAYTSYHDNFLNAVAKLQEYCSERNIEFYFIFGPSKTSICGELLPKGVNNTTEWIDRFLKQAKNLDINVIDNYDYLNDIYNNKNANIYNKQYDVYHWNDEGAFLGINNILNKIGTSINKTDDYSRTSTIKEYLNESNYKIHEEIIEFMPLFEIDDKTEEYRNGLEFMEDFDEFEYYEKNDGNNIKLLSFEGSYLISGDRTRRFIANNFGTTIAVHNYQNIFNAPYYINIFKPDCVIFEVADYVLKEYYFSEYYMSIMKLQPALCINKYDLEKAGNISCEYYDFGKYEQLIIEKPCKSDFGYLIIDGFTYDLLDYDNDYFCVTLLNGTLNEGEKISVVLASEDSDILKCYELEK